MDLLVSRKETRIQPEGPVDVLVSDIFDIYPIYDKIDQNLIVGAEFITDEAKETLDRALFATVWQRGQDPVSPEVGIQWSESIIGEVPAPVIVRQVQEAVNAEGPGVKVTFNTVLQGTRSYLTYQVDLLKS
jgi:hypothetical protein